MEKVRLGINVVHVAICISRDHLNMKTALKIQFVAKNISKN